MAFIADTFHREKERTLTEEAENERMDFIFTYGDGGCSCHIASPCSYCTHPGNPANQDEDETCWEWK